MSLIKKACFVLNFLNLKSFPSDLFFVVASSLSILWVVFVTKSSLLFIFTLAILCFLSWGSNRWMHRVWMKATENLKLIVI